MDHGWTPPGPCPGYGHAAAYYGWYRLFTLDCPITCSSIVHTQLTTPDTFTALRFVVPVLGSLHTRITPYTACTVTHGSPLPATPLVGLRLPHTRAHGFTHTYYALRTCYLPVPHAAYHTLRTPPHAGFATYATTDGWVYTPHMPRTVPTGSVHTLLPQHSWFTYHTLHLCPVLPHAVPVHVCGWELYTPAHTPHTDPMRYGLPYYTHTVVPVVPTHTHTLDYLHTRFYTQFPFILLDHRFFATRYTHIYAEPPRPPHTLQVTCSCSGYTVGLQFGSPVTTLDHYVGHTVYLRLIYTRFPDVPHTALPQLPRRAVTHLWFPTLPHLPHRLRFLWDHAPHTLPVPVTHSYTPHAVYVTVPTRPHTHAHATHIHMRLRLHLPLHTQLHTHAVPVGLRLRFVDYTRLPGPCQVVAPHYGWVLHSDHAHTYWTLCTHIHTFGCTRLVTFTPALWTVGYTAQFPVGPTAVITHGWTPHTHSSYTLHTLQFGSAPVTVTLYDLFGLPHTLHTLRTPRLRYGPAGPHTGLHYLWVPSHGHSLPPLDWWFTIGHTPHRTTRLRWLVADVTPRHRLLPTHVYPTPPQFCRTRTDILPGSRLQLRLTPVTDGPGQLFITRWLRTPRSPPCSSTVACVEPLLGYTVQAFPGYLLGCYTHVGPQTVGPGWTTFTTRTNLTFAGSRCDITVGPAPQLLSWFSCRCWYYL